MKRFTHPTLTRTHIRFKDGSSYSKYWRYLRATLILEGDQKKWEVAAAKMHKLSPIPARLSFIKEQADSSENKQTFEGGKPSFEIAFWYKN